MKYGALIAVLIISASCKSGEQTTSTSSAALKPPSTRVDETASSYFGTNVADPYRWLEDGEAPAVQMWIEAQNKHAETVMAGFTDGRRDREASGRTGYDVGGSLLAGDRRHDLVLSSRNAAAAAAGACGREVARRRSARAR